MLGVDIWSAVPFERLSTSVSSRQGFPVALRPVLELALIDQAGLELTDLFLPLLPEFWDESCMPPPPGQSLNILIKFSV